MKNRHLSSRKKFLITAGIVLAVVIIIAFVVKYWTFTHYKVEVSDSKENTLVYNYYSVDGYVLKCASDTASLCDSKNETLWTITYEMSEPQVCINGENFIIYEKNGTTVIRCNTDGRQCDYNSQLPIVRADLAEGGMVAALMDDGDTAQIDYYDLDGSVISTIKTTLTTDGYPMDIALSDDGILLGVSYIRYNNGSTSTDVKFYNFGSAGQVETDNIVSSFEYDNTIIPEMDFMGNKNCVAFGTDKIIVYEGAKAPEEVNIIEPQDEVRSVVVGDDCFATFMTGNDNNGYEINIYNKRGNSKASVNTEFAYTSVEICNGLIIMYNRNAMNIYSTDGICKFDGQFDFFVRQIRLVDSNRYVLAATDSYNIIRLY